nr:hypothetical protein [Tanacetum cinerariifolium]
MMGHMGPIEGRGRILPNVTPSHWILSKIGTIASFGSTRECFRPSRTGGRMPPKTGCQLRAHMDLFNLIRAPNPTKVKVGSHPRAPHEVPLLTLTANRVIEMDDLAVATDSSESRKRGRDGIDVNAPPKSLRRDNADPRPSGSSHGGKSLAAIQLSLASTASMPEDAPIEVNDPDLLSFADPPTRPPADVTQQYNVNLTRQVAMGSQLCLRFEQEAKLLRKSVVQVARQDRRIQARELEIKNLEALLEAEANTKKVAEDRSDRLSQELENMLAQFSDLQLKAAFEEFKRQQDEWVEQRCVEMDARLDAPSIDFNEELYPYMLTSIAGRRWVIGHGLRLAVKKCGESLELRQVFADVVSAGIAKGLSEGLKHGLEHGQAQRILESIEALKDVPMDVIMAALYLESDTEDDASQDTRDLHPSSSQLTILVYPEIRDPRNPWACKEEIVLADAIATNINLAEKKKKCRIVCRTHGVGSAHHFRSDGIPVSAPTVVPQGLALLLADAAKQTEFDDA